MFIYKKKPFIILFLYVLFPFRNIDTMSIDTSLINTLSQEEDSREEQIKITLEDGIKKNKVLNILRLLRENINLEVESKREIITILKKQKFFIFKCENENLKKKKANIEKVVSDEQISIMEVFFYNYYYIKQQEEIESIDILYQKLKIPELEDKIQKSSILNYLTDRKIENIMKKIKGITEITKKNKDKFLQSWEEKIDLIINFITQVKGLEKENKSFKYDKCITNLKQLFNQYFNLNPLIDFFENYNKSNSTISNLNIFHNTFNNILIPEEKKEEIKEYNLNYLIHFTYCLKNIQYQLYHSDNKIYKNEALINEDNTLIFCNRINVLHEILSKIYSYFNQRVDQKEIIEEWIDKLSIDTNQQTDQGKLIDSFPTDTDQGKSIDISSNQKIDQGNQNKTNPLWYMLIGIIIVVVSVLIYIFTKTKKPLPNEIIDDDLDNEVIKEL
jgi:hypothetical protein